MKLLPIGALLLVMAVPSYAQYTYTTIDDPNATGGTVVGGISGNNIVGYYTGPNGSDAQGFLYNGTTYTTVDDPNATENNSSGPNGTYVAGISGNDIVGYYFEGTGPHGGGSTSHGFIYNGSTYVSIDDPNANSFGTVVTGIDGNNIVGYYFTSSGSAGFLYNTSTSAFSTIADGAYTYPSAISGSDIVGDLQSGSFLYNGSTFSLLLISA